MKLVAAAVLTLALALQQDDAKVSELVKKLGDTEYAEREGAKKELLKIGAPALKALEGALQSPDPEVVQNARELIEKIRRNQVVEGVIKAGVKLSISVKDATFEDAAKKIGEAAGLQVRVPESLKSVPVTLEFQDAELLRVLDAMARQAKDWTYRFDGTTAVVFSEGKFIDYPAVYKGPFKFKITRVRTVTNNEFTHKTSEVELTVGMEWEPTAKPSDHSIQILEALDPEGKKFSPETQVDDGMGGMGQSSAVMTINGKTIRLVNGKVVQEDANEGGSGKTVTLRDIPKAASKFSALRCRASFVVPSAGKKEVKFDKPSAGDTQTVGDIEVHIVSVDEKTIEVELRGKNGEPIKGDLLDKSSLVIHSGDKTIEADLAEEENAMDGWDAKDVQKIMRRVQRMQRQFQGGGEKGSHFIVAIPKAAREKVDTLKFSIREIVNHQMDFEFKDLDLR